MNRDLSQMSGEELQGAIQNIMASPAFGQLLGQLQGKSPDAAEKPAMPASRFPASILVSAAEGTGCPAFAEDSHPAGPVSPSGT